MLEFPALARWRVARISNSCVSQCVSPHIDNKNEPMSAREFLQLSYKMLFKSDEFENAGSAF